MASLKALKLRIGSVKSTQKITKAMKMVAAAKLRRAQPNAEAGRPYSTRMAEVVAQPRRRASPSARRAPSCSPAPARTRRHLIVVATGDRGLAGAFNTNIVRAARKKAEELEAEGKTVLFYIVGRKGRPVIQRFYPKAIIGQHDTRAMKAPGYADAQAIADDIIDRFDERPVRRRPPRLRQLPSALAAGADGRPDHPGRPRRGRRRRQGNVAAAAVEYEPDEEEILAELLPRNIAVQIYRALLENAGRLLRQRR